MRKYLLLFLLCVAASVTYGQDVLKGQVFEAGGRVPVAQVGVQNQRTKLTATTNDKGEFSISVKVGDVITFSSFTYAPDTLLITDMHPKEVFLTLRGKMLKEVQVTHDSSKFHLSNDPMFHNQTVRYQRDANFNPVGGIAIKLNDSHGDERRRTHTKQQLKDQGTLDKINELFVPANIGKYVPLKGTDLEDFISLYRPTVEDFTVPNFNLTAYLNECYKKYQALPEEERHLPKLGGDGN